MLYERTHTREMSAYGGVWKVMPLFSALSLIRAVQDLARSEGAAEVVVGLPLGLHGEDTAQTQRARALLQALRAALDVPVTGWDERLSTREATRALAPAARRDRGRVDSAAAAVVLQAVLDARRGGRT